MRKKNLWKKTTACVLAAGLAASMAACGRGKKEEKAEKGVANTDTSQTEFDIMGGISALSKGYENNEVLNKLQDEAGIKIKWNVMSDSLSEQVNVRIAGGELPDAFMGVGFNNYDLTNYGSDGTFIDLTPYLTEEYMPNLTKILEENPDIKSAITMSDGCIYGLPAGEKMGTAGIGAEDDYSIYTIPQFSMINKAWLDDLGMEVPTTLDELHEALTAFKENDMNDLVLTPEGKVDFVCASENYRDALTYFHDWYAEGLMDKEMFSQTDTQLISKCSQGYVGVATWWYIEELMGDYAEDYVFLPILDGPDGSHNVTVRTGGATNSGNLSITSECESPANLLKFFDQWYAPENVMQLQYGPIGTYFTEQDEAGVWQSITDEQAKEKFGKSAGELKSEFEVYGPKLILSDYYSSTFKMEDRAIERLTDLNEFWMPYVDSTVTYPVDCVFTEEELDTIDMYKADFESIVAEQEGLWLKEGGPSDKEWDAYVAKLKETCGMEELLEVYQAAYDRYVEAEKAE